MSAVPTVTISITLKDIVRVITQTPGEAELWAAKKGILYRVHIQGGMHFVRRLEGQTWVLCSDIHVGTALLNHTRKLLVCRPKPKL